MKKIIIISTLLMMSLTGAAISGDLNGMNGTGLVTLSNGVEGYYWADTAAEDAALFAISTGHTQGNFAYATGSFSTTIYRKDIAGATFVKATDLLPEPGSAALYNTTTLETWGDAI